MKDIILEKAARVMFWLAIIVLCGFIAQMIAGCSNYPTTQSMKDNAKANKSLNGNPTHTR